MKCEWPQSGTKSDFLITSMITDRIGQHKVLLTINQNYDKIKNTKQIVHW